jgi:hypothetical protein
MIRANRHEDVEILARYADVPGHQWIDGQRTSVPSFGGFAHSDGGV